MLLELLIFAVDPALQTAHANLTDAGVANPRQMSSPAFPGVDNVSEVARPFPSFWNPDKSSNV